MKNTRDITLGAMLAALYVLLTVLQSQLFPGSASNAIQFRIAEALCVFALFTPSAIYGLSLGCLLSNLLLSTALPLDFLIGAAATALSTLLMYRLRNVRLWRLPLLSLLMPAVFNGLFVGWELTIFIDGLPFGLNLLYVVAGELAVLLSLGTALFFLLDSKKLKNRLFGR